MMPKRTLLAAANGYVTPVFQLDAGDSSSYSGSGQTWTNIVTSPADGSASSAYNFQRGATSSSEASDPTFNGSAGGKSINDYFSSDGGDWFTLANGTATTFINSLHKAGAKFTIVFWLKTPSSFTLQRELFNTYSSQGPGIGLTTSFNAGTLALSCLKSDGSSALGLTGPALSANTTYMFALSLNEGGGANTSRWYVNGTQTLATASYTTPSSSAAQRALNMGERNSGSVGFNTGTRIYQVLLYNTALSKAQLDYHWNRYRGRYSL